MMLQSVPYGLRGSANAVALFCYNALGYMPAPFMYGLISSVINPKNKYE